MSEIEYDWPPPQWAVEAGARLALTVKCAAEEPDYRPELAAHENARSEASNPEFKKLMDAGRAKALAVCSQPGALCEWPRWSKSGPT
jgi:hypothetical protein